MKILESRIAQYRQKEDILTAGLNKLTALDILKEISARIPSNIPIDTQELSIERNKIVLRANTDSLTSVDQIISALRDFSEFTKIEKGDIRESSDGKKAFQLTVIVGEESPKGKGTKVKT